MLYRNSVSWVLQRKVRRGLLQQKSGARYPAARVEPRKAFESPLPAAKYRLCRSDLRTPVAESDMLLEFGQCHAVCELSRSEGFSNTEDFSKLSICYLSKLNLSKIGINFEIF